MKQVKLAVTPLVCCILRNRYGDGVIAIHRSAAVYHYLQGDPVRVNETKFKKLNRELTEEVVVEVSAPIAKRLLCRKRCIRVGYYLHKVYQEEMLAYMEAQHDAGIPAQTALKTYLEKNGIGEDDYPLENAYTAWKRKKQFFREKIVGLRARSVLREKPENDSKLLPTDPRIILQAANAYYEVGMCNLVRRNIAVKKLGTRFVYLHDRARDWEYVRNRKVLAYLLHADAQLSGVEVGKLIGLHERSLQRYIAEMRLHLDQYDDVRRDAEGIRHLYKVYSS